MVLMVKVWYPTRSRVKGLGRTWEGCDDCDCSNNFTKINRLDIMPPSYATFPINFRPIN